ncbi:DUF6933 domain-containing protein [Fulvimonas yonginensis]|uniref:DUF6933 domain-containing protein n=1 Tax=Fulvimonas yonginensis TaxID=1495200 RepID=A0ABU8JEA9_9GAMM
MTVLRCTAKLLKRLKHPAKPPEPLPQANPLGEWYADIDFWHRQPFVVMLNASTGGVLMLPGNASGLRRLNEFAQLQFAWLCDGFGLRGPQVDEELRGFETGFVLAATRDRSLLASLNQRKVDCWMSMEYRGRPPPEVAAEEWEGLFTHPALGRGASSNMGYHRPLDLLRQRLLVP